MFRVLVILSRRNRERYGLILIDFVFLLLWVIFSCFFIYLIILYRMLDFVIFSCWWLDILYSSWCSWTLFWDSSYLETASGFGGLFLKYLGAEKAPHSSILDYKIPWTEEPGGLQSMGSLRVEHDWVTSLSLFTFMHWRRKWQPTPVFLPGESQGWGSLVGCWLWGTTELDMTEAT